MQRVVKSTQLAGIANLALLAAVRPGFVPGAEGASYAKRLETLFRTLNAIRMLSRESTLTPVHFPDAVGRFGILQSFRYALIPPEIGSDDGLPPKAAALAAGTWRLFLDVTFDGGWEPYMRVIYRDLGTLLDAIFCNCSGYPLAATSSYAAYCRWVRSREAEAGLFYTESPASAMDQRYLADVERIHRQAACPVAARQQVAGLALPAVASAAASAQSFAALPEPQRHEIVYNNMRALKGLYDLRALYADNDDGDESCLLRFARSVFTEFARVLPAARPQLHEHEPLIAWLLDTPPKALKPPPPSPDARPVARLPPPHGEVQRGVLKPFIATTHGCLLLLSVTDARAARKWLNKLPLTTEATDELQPGQVYWNVAFTRQGLQALEVPADDMALLPQEFVDGMEARAGLLGDRHHNHPEHWQRPRQGGVEIDLGSVHVVLQWRLSDAGSASAGLHPALAALRGPFIAGVPGLLLLADEPMRSHPQKDNVTREHFGFRDGMSQPRIDAAGKGTDRDHVPAGELLLGHPSLRDATPWPAQPNPLLDNGSFLVLRKLSQDVDAWNALLDGNCRRLDPAYDGADDTARQAARHSLAARLMGRDHGGTPLVPGALGDNDFDYAADPQGSACPFQSHVRRANPRNADARVPRLMRRGMSYGPRFEDDPQAPRGLYFMAYCGSIAEQFEIVQRWLAGGNSSGVLSAHSDPMLGVAEPGRPRSFPWLRGAGDAVVVDLDAERPVTRLLWGLYLFAPSATGLKTLAQQRRGIAPGGPQPWLKSGAYRPKGPAFEAVRRLVQDGDRRGALWQAVRAAPGSAVQTPYGLLVGGREQALAILKDRGRTYSVAGYGKRFQASIGDGFLGMDPDAGHTRLAERSGVKEAIAACDERRAFGDAFGQAAQALGRLPAAAAAPTGTNVDCAALAENVLGGLCSDWFGLPDGSSVLLGTSADPIDGGAPRCPRDLVHAARHIFGAHPTALESERAIRQGRKLAAAALARVGDGSRALVGLAEAIRVRLHAQGESAATIAQTITGVMLGFAPSTNGNFLNVLRAWTEARPTTPNTLWDLQARLLAERRRHPLAAGANAAAAAQWTWTTARDALRPLLIAQLQRDLVPATIWRQRAGDTARDPEKIVIGLHGIVQDPDCPEALLFGGTVKPGPLHTPHACPGSGIAIGTLLGIFGAILLAGTLRSTPSPTILRIVREG